MALECAKGNRALKAFKWHKSNCMLWQLVQLFDKVQEEMNHIARKSYYSKKGLVLYFFSSLFSSCKISYEECYFLMRLRCLLLHIFAISFWAFLNLLFKYQRVRKYFLEQGEVIFIYASLFF